MGFCLLNNIAIAARYALNHPGVDRVAIVDFDVHHGNGTQDVFYQERQVLFCSTHASPYYPGTGLIHEMGAEMGAGSTLNVPLPFKLGDKGYEQIFAEVVIPAVQRWNPDLLLVSAGYDAHWLDPIGPMVLSTSGYNQLTRMLYDLAAEMCNGRIAMILEGGYSLEALGAGVTAAVRILQGQDPGKDPFGPMTPPEPDVSDRIKWLHTQHPLFLKKEEERNKDRSM
jgi:acetoin utilization deacetylase AcuC-like enzyme